MNQAVVIDELCYTAKKRYWLNGCQINLAKPIFSAFRLVLDSVHVCFQVVTYLAGCGLQNCPMLIARGYPDIGWNPIEGERYLSFLRFAVFVNG